MTGNRSESVDRIQSAADCSAEELSAFFGLVARGHEVSATGLVNRIARAHWLGFHFEDGELVGVAALKQPSENYRDKVFQRSRTQLAAARFDMELGWVYVREGFRRRGISRRLLEKLMAKARNKGVFATTSIENFRMRSLLPSLGFEATGQPFSGLTSNRKLELWIRLPESAQSSNN